jgi:hypothetical protein
MAVRDVTWFFVAGLSAFVLTAVVYTVAGFTDWVASASICAAMAGWLGSIWCGLRAECVGHCAPWKWFVAIPVPLAVIWLEDSMWIMNGATLVLFCVFAVLEIAIWRRRATRASPLS